MEKNVYIIVSLFTSKNRLIIKNRYLYNDYLDYHQKVALEYIHMDLLRLHKNTEDEIGTSHNLEIF